MPGAQRHPAPSISSTRGRHGAGPEDSRGLGEGDEEGQEGPSVWASSWQQGRGTTTRPAAQRVFSWGLRLRVGRWAESRLPQLPGHTPLLWTPEAQGQTARPRGGLRPGHGRRRHSPRGLQPSPRVGLHPALQNHTQGFWAVTDPPPLAWRGEGGGDAGPWTGLRMARCRPTLTPVNGCLGQGGPQEAQEPGGTAAVHGAGRRAHTDPQGPQTGPPGHAGRFQRRGREEASRMTTQTVVLKPSPRFTLELHPSLRYERGTGQGRSQGRQSSGGWIRPFLDQGVNGLMGHPGSGSVIKANWFCAL